MTIDLFLTSNLEIKHRALFSHWCTSKLVYSYGAPLLDCAALESWWINAQHTFVYNILVTRPWKPLYNHATLFIHILLVFLLFFTFYIWITFLNQLTCDHRHNNDASWDYCKPDRIKIFGETFNSCLKATSSICSLVTDLLWKKSPGHLCSSLLQSIVCFIIRWPLAAIITMMGAKKEVTWNIIKSNKVCVRRRLGCMDGSKKYRTLK